MKATILIGSRRERHLLVERNALAFKNWWDNGPIADAKGKPVKVDFSGGGFQVLPNGAKGGYNRTALDVRFD